MDKDHDDESTMPPATRSKYRYAMIFGVIAVAVAMIIFVIVGAMTN